MATDTTVQALQSIIGAPPAASNLSPMSGVVAFNPSDFNVPNLNQYLQQAYSTLAPYYTKILQQAQGDYNDAIQMLQNTQSLQDYSINASAALQDYQTTQNLNAAIQQLGLQFPQETQQLLDSLNKRGIATTQAQPDQATSPLDVAKGGESGYEMGNLTQDQQLRQEAVQRSAQQQQQNTALTKQTGLAQAQQSYNQGALTQGQNMRNTQQSAEQNLESGTMALAGQSAQTAISQQQLALEQKQASQQFGGGSGGPPPMPRPGTAPYNVGQQQNGYRWTGVGWDPLT